jgi:hypothetical protein
MPAWLEAIANQAAGPLQGQTGAVPQAPSKQRRDLHNSGANSPNHAGVQAGSCGMVAGAPQHSEQRQPLDT